jgi:hypothetical protein
MVVLSQYTDPGLTIWKARSISDATPMRIVNSDPASDGVTVNSICRSGRRKSSAGGSGSSAGTSSANWPIGRPCKSENARSAVVLASDQGACYVGATMSPDGGDIVL